MTIQRVHLIEAARARGVVIVIDVIRAFSVAAYALDRGARGLWLVRTIEDALALRKREPEALLAGEVGGRLIAGFDLNNSPACIAETDLRGRLLIQRTGAGTQGAVGAVNAAHLLVASLVNARATATYARQLAETTDGIITLLPTESGDGMESYRREDDLCADYLEALLLQRDDAPEVLAQGIAGLRAGGRFALFEQGHPDFPPGDIDAVLAADRFAFVMPGAREHWNGIAYVAVQRAEVPMGTS